jgi:class 3 adenylate cyclase
MNRTIDVRAVLPLLHVPTLILRRSGDRGVLLEDCQYLAEHIAGAKFVELPGNAHMEWVDDSDAIVNAIQEFLTGEQSVEEPDRVLATVLFTDIVDSTKQAAQYGDQRWRELLDSHNALVQKAIERFRGRAIKSTGDGYLATFDGPARAIRCAFAIRDAVRRIGLEIRAGLHTGEIELIGEDVGGIAVHIAARVAAKAEANAVWVSRTVRDLVAGSGFEFTEQGIYALKGVPDEWHLFTVDKG